ncbi:MULTISPECIES: iron-hydroxamate ABC transporter substrate-binding protein [Bacillaceae]|uniref:iron-hydroxamate ABC transporter substrate-binding protein n=1 Tax=Bacillaceae TaxID=186817 RepID=UPI001E4590F3|nr:MULTISPECIES: iron-hydroxamate ABC transporter substrate-binding protein [Bacillaceae]MCE4049840.1 iron-hydroxamate ABC transporter substrate-binding protein [Bacillus sp. Au-Bac7]MCM3032240.1 iron-hydroxamate ABC transporter substrate-binding protein [Niallia sp. MER 6]MDL0435408.1 iron-hydroxamate ABC transporter substrate-binding protein [Niallia sp. SS-2023]UPO87597.1 iron-hydroxamate ABC transporter substrate-binding protein [Niallia sp. Man26]
MKKSLLPMILILLLVISACGNKASETNGNTEDTDKKSGTITYQSENGPVEVPADPQRVVVLSTFTGNVMALGVNVVGVDSWSKQNPRFDSELKDVEEVTDENLEKIIELKPDLIIGLSTIKNVDKLNEIAPTVTFTYGKADYLTQHLEIGKLLNKEKEAQVWVDDFKQRADAAGKEIKAKIGEDATVTVIENFNKQMYVFGNNWGRGTEILYQAMKLNMPEKVKEMALADGYYALSSEVLPEYVGDYLIISEYADQDNSYQETEAYKNIPAVKNNHVFKANANEFYFNDPVTLDYQLEFFKEHFLGN